MKQGEFRETRKQLGMSQAGLAEALGMSRTTIGYYERGRNRQPSVIPQVVNLAMMALWHRLEEPFPLLPPWE